MSGAGARPLLFCATGIAQTVGGIAAANRNVLAALETIGAASGRQVRTLILNEPLERSAAGRSFGGDQMGFALAVAARALVSGLVVFDHVRLALPILAIPRSLRPPVVICAHGSESWRRIRPASIRAFQAADLVLTNSNYTFQHMVSRFSGFRGVACPLGLPPQFALTLAAPAWKAEPVHIEAADGVVRELGARMLLLVGRVDAGEQEKGHRELLDIFPRVAASFPEAQLVFVGGGSDLAALRDLAAGSSVADRLFLTGLAPDGLLQRLYGKAYAYVMPSRQEGFGLAYLEAMNQAKPCLACRDDGGGDVVVEGETGVLVGRDFSGDELYDAIASLLVDPDRARRYGEAGWRRLADEFTAAAHQRRMVDLLTPLLST